MVHEMSAGANAELAELIDRWPGLHEATRLRIMAILHEDFDPDAY